MIFFLKIFDAATYNSNRHLANNTISTWRNAMSTNPTLSQRLLAGLLSALSRDDGESAISPSQRVALNGVYKLVDAFCDAIDSVTYKTVVSLDWDALKSDSATPKQERFPVKAYAKIADLLLVLAGESYKSKTSNIMFYVLNRALHDTDYEWRTGGREESRMIAALTNDDGSTYAPNTISTQMGQTHAVLRFFGLIKEAKRDGRNLTLKINATSPLARVLKSKLTDWTPIKLDR